MQRTKNSLIKYLFIVVALLMAMPVIASEFSFDIQDKNISVGDQFKVDVNINTEKENINAIEGKIVFNSNLFELSEIRSGNSVVNFWINKPTNNNGTISFSGITPGGYILDKALVFSLIFTAKKEGTAIIDIGNANALKNDGKGTASNIKTSNLQIEIASSTGNETNLNLKIVDITPPDIFTPEVGQDTSLFNDKWFVVFVAQDKGSGIAKYEVKESRYNIFSALGGPASGWNFSKWNDATSPYVLADQYLHSYIFVKAIDNSGNERVIKLSPRNPIAWYANLENWFIIVLVIVIVALIFFYKNKLWKKN